MAITTTSQTLHDGVRNVIMQFTGISDGSGQEAAVVKVDVSEMTPPCDRVKILKLTHDVNGGVVTLSWAADTPVVFAQLSGQNETCYRFQGGLQNSADESRTGDILLSTQGFELESSYTIKLEMVKKFDR
jgi:hypothetical protein